jgi:hypothetical protein
MTTLRFFGLDLSGYSANRSALAEVARSDEYQARVYRNHPFVRSAEGRDQLRDLIRNQRTALARLLGHGVLLVDVPIDLQRLPSPEQPIFVWQLTLRPVDKAYGGLPPLADRIGAPVARFRNLLAASEFKASAANLRETYPAASLLCAGARHQKYKGQTIVWDGERWVGHQLAEVAQALRLVAEQPVTLTDDDVDAVICALAGAAPAGAILEGEALATDMRTRIASKLRRSDPVDVQALYPPENYRLLRSLPESNVWVRLCNWSTIEEF